MGVILYRCEVKGIQPFVLSGRKLRQMVGASALLEGLIRPDGEGSALEVTLRDVCEDRARIVAAAAAGATLAFVSVDDLAEFAAAWPRVVDSVTPGVTLVQAWVPTEASDLDAVRELEGDQVKQLGERLAAARNRVPPDLPVANPVLERVSLGTRAATGREKKGSGYRDRAITAMDEAAKKGSPWRDELIGVLTGGADPEGELSDDFGALAGGDDRSYLAVIHADGNNVGSRIRRLSKLKEYEAFAAALSTATREAVGEAYGQTCAEAGRDGVLPIRPVVIGGDDLTAIVRADRALAFVKAFCAAFARKTDERKDALGGSGLTASAGVAFVRATHPVNLGYQLAEALTKTAKRAGRALDADRSPAMVALHRVTTSLNPTAAELKGALAADPALRLTGGPYLLDAADETIAPGYWTLDALLALAACFDDAKLPRGPLRAMLTAMQTNPIEAQRSYERLRSVQRGNDEASALWTRNVGPRLGAFAGMEDDRFPWSSPLERMGDDEGLLRRTPWLDAVALRALAVHQGEALDEGAADEEARDA